ncbi:MAG: hypothetical protein KJ060_16940 [Candidatus Hydrogenedentes bacterium]|nr:hypothetical protein [Candidatus Hydrogenedentota bacterium]
MDKSTKILLIVALVGLLVVIGAVRYVWKDATGETDYDRQYQENLEKNKAYFDQMQPVVETPE